MAESKLEIIITAVDKASGPLGQVGSGLSNLAGLAGKTLVVGLTAGAAAVGAMGLALGKLTVDALPLEGIKAAFEGIVTASGQAADAVLADLQRASSGMISARDLMTSFNQAAGLVSEEFAFNLAPAMELIGKMAAATGQDFNFLLDSYVRGVGRLSPMILDNLQVQVDLNSAYEAYAASIGKTVDELTKQDQQMAVSAQVLDLLAVKTANMPDVTESAAASVASLNTMWQDLRDTLGLALIPVIKPLLQLLTQMAADVVPKLVAAFERNVIPAVQGVVGAITMLLDSGAGSLNFFDALGSILGENVMAALRPLTDAFANLFGAFLEHVPLMIAKGQELMGWLQQAFGTVAPVIIQGLADVINFIAEVWRKNGDDIIRIVSVVFKILVATIGGAMALIAGVISATWSFIRGDWEGVQNAIKNALTAFLNLALSLVGTNLTQFVAVWRNNFQMARIIVSTVLNNILSAIRGFFGSMAAAGKSLIDGLIGGMIDALNRRLAEIKRLAQTIANTVRNALGIKSPSSVFAEIGRQITAGLAQGISMSALAPQQALAATASQMTGAAGGVGIGGGSFTFVYSPMISLADRAEAERVLAPMIEAVLRRQLPVRVR